MKIPISNYINDLLFHHDCVVVSGLGAFILNSESAIVDEKGKIEPPKKIISFNRLINQNDGLLANYISEKPLNQLRRRMHRNCTFLQKNNV